MNRIVLSALALILGGGVLGSFFSTLLGMGTEQAALVAFVIFVAGVGIGLFLSLFARMR